MRPVPGRFGRLYGVATSNESTYPLAGFMETEAGGFTGPLNIADVPGTRAGYAEGLLGPLAASALMGDSGQDSHSLICFVPQSTHCRNSHVS